MSVPQVDNEMLMAIFARLEHIAIQSKQCFLARLSNFAAWTPRTAIVRFLAEYYIYQRILGVHGVVIEGGVGMGAGLFTWFHLGSILEPNNYTRTVIGFDAVEEESVWEDLHRLGEFHDLTRAFGNIPRLEFIKGDACETMPKYVQEHPGLIVSLLVLDFTKGPPTRVALDTFYPLLSPGGIVVSGGIFSEELAELPSGLAWQRCPWSPTLIFAVKP